MLRLVLFSLFLLFIFSCGPSLPEEVKLALSEIPEEIDYNFHVKPILSDRCYSCHGPDEESRKADLRLDIEADAYKVLESGNRAVVAGIISKSAMATRILSADHEFMMPPSDSKLKLLPEEKAVLVKWIKQGAAFKKHWSFIKPEKPNLPEVRPEFEANNPIDHFILQQLAGTGLQQSLKAEAERLLRRVYMDLTGLPPGKKQMDDFMQDHSVEAYEQIIDELLASDACAERLTMEWMDVARYADSHGLHADGWRNMWPWRDWVIQAFRENLPYDEFVTLQLAGDLVPDAGRNEILATAFHRNHPMTAEGGAIDEEYRLEYVADRTNTTANAFMGLTMECAKCHDHKFDPISQKEYYQMSAFFNNVKELGMTGDDGNFGPMLTLESAETASLLAELDKKVEEINEKIISHENVLKLTLLDNKTLPNISLNANLAIYMPGERLDRRQVKKRSTILVDLNTSCTTNGDPEVVPGKQGNAIKFDAEYDELYVHDLPAVDVQDVLSFAAWVNTDKRIKGKMQVIVGNASEKNTFWRGWDFFLDDQNRLSFRMIHSLPHNYFHVVSLDSIRLNTWTHVAFSYDGSSRAEGAKLFINGKQVDMHIPYNRLTKNIRPIQTLSHVEITKPLRIGKSYRAFTGENGIYRGIMDEIRIYRKELSPLEIGKLAGIEPEKLPDNTRWQHLALSDPSILRLKKERAEIIKKSVSVRDTVPEIMVMEEMPSRRPTHILNRGEYSSPLEEVKAMTPNQILAFPEDFSKDRLGLAKWLFHPDHPLTARVTVNRYWQMIFGRGLVKSANDFGSQGALPSHPELLDWLATSFIENNWDVKWLLKLMVSSATYQQSSIAETIQREIDPENIYLSRSPSYRWPAEMIRDNVLAASGLLVKKAGGPSVKPYQPDGLWIEKGNFSHKLLRYETDSGDDLYRRSLYTFIKRTSPHPVMTIFDVPSRDVCMLTRESTNTPLQALVLLNDPQFVEAARILAERIQKEEETFEERASMAFRLLTGRKPGEKEIEVLEAVYMQQLENFEQNGSAAKALLTVGDISRDADLPLLETAAWTMVTSTIINHDEAYMKR